MKKFLLSITLTTLLCVAGFSYADSEAMPMPVVAASERGGFYFTMIPEQYHFEKDEVIIDKPAFGKAYKLNEKGDSELLWEVSGWYAFKVFISNDGQYLVRVGDWYGGDKPSKEDYAVGFYKNGIEFKSYSTKDLIKNPSEVLQTTSHYIWRAFDKHYPKMVSENKFQIKTIDDFIYTFDITTGEIIDTLKL